MKTMFATTAAALLGTVAMADNHNQEADASGSMQSESGNEVQAASNDGNMDSNDLSAMQGQLIRTTDITGAPIYTTNEAQDEGWDPDFTYDAVGGDWNQIGTITDVALDQSGNLRGFVASIGGFLDIGDKDVLISVEDANFVAADDYSFVTRLNEEDLESMDSVSADFWS
ncbi:PRC-barrel domain-containing protein [Roseivivax sediminis]|uniref:PRC-barrel domain-containing protein n=1 Tax=Roseivivax sediminis TaxID=936889 RepID=A0A1I2C5N4_9RHOB|nr:PRC-barrel domain-containing protein [Roseivivax sediminis]SFE63505.1 PRC-barrel domain-containing protein [Roseivivax sediminis]